MGIQRVRERKGLVKPSAFFLALAFISLKGYGSYFRGKHPAPSQTSCDTWLLTSVPVGRAVVVTLENVKGLPLPCFHLQMDASIALCAVAFSLPSSFSLS